MGFHPKAIYPIHFHAFPGSFKDEHPSLHAEIAEIVEQAGLRDHRLVPHSSSFRLGPSKTAMSHLKIIMYHYVRDPERSRYPRIKGRRTAEFRNQLDYLARHFNPVTAQQVIAASRGRECDLPQNAVWLTFDDGYLDHYLTVFPLLHDRGWQGSFFAPARAVMEGKLLDVNKIHLLLAAVDDTSKLVSEIQEYVGPAFEQLWSAHAAPDAYDPLDVVFVKKVLQHVLPLRDRTRIVDDPFCKARVVRRTRDRLRDFTCPRTKSS